MRTDGFALVGGELEQCGENGQGQFHGENGIAAEGGRAFHGFWLEFLGFALGLGWTPRVRQPVNPLFAVR